MAENQKIYIQIEPREYLCSLDRVMGSRALGILLHLAMFAVRDDLFSTEPAQLSRLCGVSPYVFKKEWPHIERFFERTEKGRLRLVAPEWLTVRIRSTDRQPLTHLLPNLIEFWGPLCAYCGADAPLEVEHIVPLARGGSNDIANLTVACRPCNLRKRTLTAAEFGHPDIHHRALGLVQ